MTLPDPARRVALEDYKAGPGLLKAGLLAENRAKLKGAKKQAKELALGINAIKRELDVLKAKSEEQKRARQAGAGDGAQVGGARQAGAGDTWGVSEHNVGQYMTVGVVQGMWWRYRTGGAVLDGGSTGQVEWYRACGGGTGQVGRYWMVAVHDRWSHVVAVLDGGST